MLLINAKINVDIVDHKTVLSFGCTIIKVYYRKGYKSRSIIHIQKNPGSGMERALNTD